MRNNMNTSVNKRIDKIKEGRGYEMALQCVEMKFECCGENKSESYTVYIKEGLKRWNTDEAVLPLMKKIVDAISLEKDGSITITLINQAKIIGGNKNASSNTID